EPYDPSIGAAFARPDPAVDVDAAFVLGTVVAAVAVCETAVFAGVMVAAAKGPLVVQGPYDRGTQARQAFRRDEAAADPMKVDDRRRGPVGVGGRRAGQPGRRDRRGVASAQKMPRQIIEIGCHLAP